MPKFPKCPHGGKEKIPNFIQIIEVCEVQDYEVCNECVKEIKLLLKGKGPVILTGELEGSNELPELDNG